MSRPGGTTAPKPIDDAAKQVALSVKSEIESKAGKTFSTFEPKEYSTQVVAGINYFFKIDVGNGEFVHARVYKDLSQNVSLHSIKTSLSATDSLAYF
ncbi:Cystatin-A [Balamuthia mandrillaris]